MDDERTLHEVDARVRAALTADEATRCRVFSCAFAADLDRQSHRRASRYVAGAIAALALFVAAWEWRRAPSTTSELSLTVVGKGSMVIVEAHDGRRWILGPPLERPASGNYIIAVRD